MFSGALQKALVRTFRSDIVKHSGENDPEKLESMLPKGSVNTPSEAPPIQQLKEKNEAIVHTLKDDVQGLVRDKKMSLVRMAALESQKGHGSFAEVKKKSPWRVAMFVSLVILFLVIGGVVAVGGYYAYRLNVAPGTTTAFQSEILFAESLTRLDVSNKSGYSVLTALANAKDRSRPALGSVTEIYLGKIIGEPVLGEPVVQKRLTSNEFLSLIEADTPQTFVQTLDPDYMLGMYTTDDGNIPFLVLKNSSYSYAFSGMLNWENSLMRNLSPFFSDSSLADTQSFEDTVVQNLDVRVLGGMQNPHLLYSFINRTTVVITTDARTLLEVANRVRIQK